jgi:hypothetical protein
MKRLTQGISWISIGHKQYTHVHLLYRPNHLNISTCIASATKRVLLTSKSASMPNHKLQLVRSPLHMWGFKQEQQFQVYCSQKTWGSLNDHLRGSGIFSSLKEVKGNLSSREPFTQLMEIESNTNITTKDYALYICQISNSSRTHICYQCADSSIFFWQHSLNQLLSNIIEFIYTWFREISCQVPHTWITNIQLQRQTPEKHIR